MANFTLSAVAVAKTGTVASVVIAQYMNVKAANHECHLANTGLNAKADRAMVALQNMTEDLNMHGVKFAFVVNEVA